MRLLESPDLGTGIGIGIYLVLAGSLGLMAAGVIPGAATEAGFLIGRLASVTRPTMDRF